MDDHLMPRIIDHLMRTSTMFKRFQKSRGNGYKHRNFFISNITNITSSIVEHFSVRSCGTREYEHGMPRLVHIRSESALVCQPIVIFSGPT